jgi:hypothetical protein
MVLARYNHVALLQGVPNPMALGISTSGAENLLVEKNILHSMGTPLIERWSSKAHFFGNQTPSGELLRSLDGDTAKYYEDLADNVMDALILSF